MRYPKERMARENETEMLRWLRAHEYSLPLTLYELGKKLNWTFGAVRGTVLRLKKNLETGVILKDITDTTGKRFKSYVALRGHESELRLKELADRYSKSMPAAGEWALPAEKKAVLIQLLTRLKVMDENVAKLSDEIQEPSILEKLITYNFGLVESERASLLGLLADLTESDKKPPRA